MATRTNAKATSDEEIIAAILQAGTVKEAASILQMPPRTLYERMRSKDFRIAYQQAKTDILRQAVKNINAKLTDAITAVSDIASNTEINAQTRLQAAQTIISYSIKFAELVRDGECAAFNLTDPWADMEN